MFTGGSETNAGTAFAYHYLQSTAQKIQPHTSIFTAELYAIYNCLNKAQNMRRAPIATHTDSRSAMQSIVSLTPSNPLVQLIRNRVAVSGRSANFCWVPSHTGVPGNERADATTKDATSGGRVGKVELPRGDVKFIARE